MFLGFPFNVDLTFEFADCGSFFCRAVKGGGSERAWVILSEGNSMLAAVYTWYILALIFATESKVHILLRSDESGSLLTGSIWSSARTLEGLTTTKKNKKR